jgi:hypothetical protein
VAASASAAAVRRTPSGVSSKAQASTRATGKPSATRAMTSVTVHGGSPRFGKIVSLISISSHPTTA